MTTQTEPQRTSPIRSALRTFLLDLEAAGRARGTIRFYHTKLRRFVKSLEDAGITKPEAITPDHIRQYIATLRETSSPGGVHAHWRAIRAFIRFLVREGELDHNPLDRIRAPSNDEPILDPVDEHAVRALLATCDRSDIGLRDRAIILMLLDTGLRASELLALNVGDVDPGSGTVYVRKSKSHHARVVFLGRKARRALRAYLRTRGNMRPDDPLIIAYHRDGERLRMRYDGLRDMLRRRSERAGIPTVTPHMFRRAFALNMLRAGADVVTISRLMGHGSLPVLLRYLKQQEEDLRGTHRRASPVENWGL